MPIEGELTAPDDSLRGELEAAFGGGDDGANTDGQSHSDEGAGGEQSMVPAPAETGDAGSETRARDASGKFVPKSETETKAAPEKVAAVDPNSPSTDAAKASTGTAQPAAVAPPAGWTAVEKAEWTKLSPAVQAAVSRREAEISRGGQQWSEEKRRYEAVLSPVAEAARRNGMNTEQGLQALLNAQSFLERDPTAAIKWLAQSHGVNLATLAGSPDDVPSAQAPDIEAIVRRAVQQTVQPIVAPIQDRWQQEEHSRQETTTQMVVDFAASPGHEHFNGVEEEIMAMIPPLKARNPTWTPQQVLQEAYDRATYANPATRQSILTERETAAEAKRREEASQRATKARGAAVSVTGSPQGSAGQEPAGSLRDEIMRAMTG
jgi:hypothetical protein